MGSDLKKGESSRAMSMVRLMQQAFALLPEAVCVCDRDHNIVTCNATMSRLVGLEPKVVIGKEFGSVFNFFPTVLLKPAWERVWQTQTMESQELPCHHSGAEAKREETWCHVTHVPLLSAQGQVNWVMSVWRDITERKRAMDELRSVQMRFRIIEENLREVIWVGSPDWKTFFYVSPAFDEVWGRSRKLLFEQPGAWIDLVHSEDRAALLADIQRKVAGDFTRPNLPDFRISLPSGDSRWIGTNVFPVRNESSRVEAVVGIGEDITHRRVIEQERESLIRELQASLAHVKNLRGLLPICAACKKIRDDHGYWSSVESYISHHADVTFTHGLCPDCLQKFYLEAMSTPGAASHSLPRNPLSSSAKAAASS